jgi:protocatechuate 3,4-dioxygenase beta subunit
MNDNNRLKVTRRQSLILAAGTALSACSLGRQVSAEDGVGPNRGVLAKTLRGKQTCNNSIVPVSDTGSRLSVPADFNGAQCQMMEDSFEGPYFTCTPAPGRNIAEGQAGQPLTVAMRLVDRNCNPIRKGVVDIWACNATGHYSGYSNSPNERPPMARAILFGHIKPDVATRFCRGALITDQDGIAEFDTIYPGFYYGQPIHIHMKAHVAGRNLLTSQANLPEPVNERIMQMAPYADPRPIKRSTKSTGFPVMRVQTRADRLLATLDLIAPD